LENGQTKPLGIEIKHLAILINRAFYKQLISDGDFEYGESSEHLTMMQSHTIGYIYDSPNHTIPQRDLEKEFSRRRSTITGILKLMEKNGYITREYSKEDARVKMVTLTDKAIRLHHEVTSKINAFNEKLEYGITESELQTLRTVIDKVKNNLEE
jgi:DNA-binding MarR family transcriptional regulator